MELVDLSSLGSFKSIVREVISSIFIEIFITILLILPKTADSDFMSLPVMFSVSVFNCSLDAFS